MIDDDDDCSDPAEPESPEADATAEAGLPGADDDDDDWTMEQQLRRQLRQLHDAVVAHIVGGDFVPSIELEAALLSAKSEADWC